MTIHEMKKKKRCGICGTRRTKNIRILYDPEICEFPLCENCLNVNVMSGALIVPCPEPDCGQVNLENDICKCKITIEESIKLETVINTNGCITVHMSEYA